MKNNAENDTYKVTIDGEITEISKVTINGLAETVENYTDQNCFDEALLSIALFFASYDSAYRGYVEKFMLYSQMQCKDLSESYRRDNYGVNMLLDIAIRINPEIAKLLRSKL